MDLYIRPILTAEEADDIVNRLKQSDTSEWKGGTASMKYIEADGYSSTKRNDEYYGGELNYIHKILFGKIDSLDHYWLDGINAKNSTSPIISKTFEGGFYRPHNDAGSSGHYSTTIFLNDDFEGGELSLLINGEEVKCKAEKGKAITYPTGTPHCVNTVTKGNRYAAVFWTTSYIQDEYMRNLHHSLATALTYIPRCKEETLEDATKHPAFLIQNAMFSIQRNFGKIG